MIQKYQKWKKYFTTSDNNIFMNNILYAKIKEKKLVNESNFVDFEKRSYFHDKQKD